MLHSWLVIIFVRHRKTAFLVEAELVADARGHNRNATERLIFHWTRTGYNENTVITMINSGGSIKAVKVFSDSLCVL